MWKSQTVINLMADTVGRGGSVLFVAAKSAAREVVIERLGRIGMGRLSLHLDTTTGRTELYERLNQTLEWLSVQPETLPGQGSATLRPECPGTPTRHRGRLGRLLPCGE